MQTCVDSSLHLDTERINVVLVNSSWAVGREGGRVCISWPLSLGYTTVLSLIYLYIRPVQHSVKGALNLRQEGSNIPEILALRA